MTETSAHNRDPRTPHRFEAKILQHRHVVGQIIICGNCGMTAYQCRAAGAA